MLDGGDTVSKGVESQDKVKFKQGSRGKSALLKRLLFVPRGQREK